MDDNQTDEQLMQRLCQGEDAPLGMLVRRWSSRLQCFVQRMCGYLGRCEDIAQDTWTRVYLYRKSYRPGGRFRAYLFAIAFNVCSSAMRSESWWRRVTRLGDDDQSPPPPAEDRPPLDVLIEQERKARLDIAIAELPAAQKATVLLYMLCDQDYSQIAQILQRPQGTIRSNMHHALKSLRDSLTWAAAQDEVNHERQTNR